MKHRRPDIVIPPRKGRNSSLPDKRNLRANDPRQNAQTVSILVTPWRNVGKKAEAVWARPWNGGSWQETGEMVKKGNRRGRAKCKGNPR